MVKLNCTFFSECLGRDANIIVLLPANTSKRCAHYPVLYLLHGLTDSAESWMFRTSLERYADAHGMAIVLPNAARSFYCDMAYGDAWYTHIAQEIPAFCESVFPISQDPKQRYIAGNSMGAYGACKIALKEPGQFSKVGLFSGVLDVQKMVNDIPELHRDWQLCFGGTQVPEQEDLLKLLSEATSFPAFYHYCGTDDFLAEGNRKFCRLCNTLNIPLSSVWENGGQHRWDYWDKQLPCFLNWLEAHQERMCTP